MGEFRAREFSSAFRDLLPYADSSDSEIQMALGYLYDFKSPPEPEKAAEIFRKAAARGVPEATYMLGFQSYKGLGVSRDPVAAAKYFEQAAALGEHDAKLALAYLYLNGEGVEKDLARSKNWQDQAEQDGVVGPRAPLVAPYRPGYYFKKGSRHDDAELEKIRTEGAVYGAEQGDIFSLYTLANQISHGLAPGVSTQDLTNWTRRAADSGEADAMWMMAIGLSTTLEEREMWLQKGANLWDIDAMLMLSQLERNKKPPNLVEAYKYCTLYSLGKNPNTQLPAHDCVEWANPGPAGDEAVASFLRDSPRPEGAEHRTHISDLH
jgi:TPR repeat protein